MVQSRMLPPWPPLWPLYVWSLIYSCRDGEIFMETTNITCVNERIWLRVTSNTAKSATHTQPTTIWWKFLHLKSIADAHRQPILPKELALQWPAFFSFFCLHKMFEGTSRVFHDNDASEYWTKCIFPNCTPGAQTNENKKIVKFALRKYKFFYLYSFSSVEVENKAEAEMENVYSNSIIIWRCTNMS